MKYNPLLYFLPDSKIGIHQAPTEKELSVTKQLLRRCLVTKNLSVSQHMMDPDKSFKILSQLPKWVQTSKRPSHAAVVLRAEGEVREGGVEGRE